MTLTRPRLAARRRAHAETAPFAADAGMSPAAHPSADI
jgi:hypothetical protein